MVGQVVGIDVKTHPQFSSEELAVQMAEALQTSFNLRDDATEFSKQIGVENRKMAELKMIISNVEQYRRHPPEKVSRMEPMMSYDLESLKHQLDDAEKNVEEWKRRSDEFTERSVQLQKHATYLQQEIAKQNKK